MIISKNLSILTALLCLGAALPSAHAQSKGKKKDDTAKAELTDEEVAAAEAKAAAEETEKAENDWQSRLIPTVVSSSPDAPAELIVGEPVADADPNGQRRVYMPYPPRPVTLLPPGWVLRPSDSLPPHTRNIVLADGRRILLEFPTLEIAPDDAGDGSVPMQEPGFDPRKPQQTDTINVALERFIAHTESDRETLGTALREMEQILLSSPRAPQPAAQPSSTANGPSSPLLPPSPPRG